MEKQKQIAISNSNYYNLSSNHIVSQQKLAFQQNKQKLTFHVKNLSLKTTSFQIIIPFPKNHHYKLLTPRTFNLAPGITQSCTIKHITDQKQSSKINYQNSCSNKKTTILIKSSLKQQSKITLFCRQPILKQQPIILYPKHIDLGQVYQSKIVQIPIQNISEHALKVDILQNTSSLTTNNNQYSNTLTECTNTNNQMKGSNITPRTFMNLNNSISNGIANKGGLTQRNKKYSLELQKNQFILLKDKKTTIQAQIHLLQSGDFTITLLLKVIKEQKQFKPYNYYITITGSSFKKNQYVGDQQGNKIDLIDIEMINGTVYKSHFYVYNDYHKNSKFSITPHIRCNKPCQFASKWKQHKITFYPQQGIIQSFSELRVDYQIQTFLNQDDQNFAIKYAKISINDDVIAFKMRKLPYFRKNSDMQVQIEFQGVSTQKITHKCSIINSAIKIQEEKGYLKIHNDSGLLIPFSFTPNTFYKIIPQKGTIQSKGITQIKINEKPSSIINPVISMNLPQVTIYIQPQNYKQQLYDEIDQPKSNNLIRNKSANIIKSNFFVNKNNNNYKINNVSIKRPISAFKTNNRPFSGLSNPASILRPISAALRPNSGFINNKSIYGSSSKVSTKYKPLNGKAKIITRSDFLKTQPKYKNLQPLSNEELQNLQITYRNGTNLITNTHPQKSIMLKFEDRGYLVIPSNKSYQIRQSFEQLQFKVNKQKFVLTKCPETQVNQEKQFYVTPRELSFNFVQDQKQFQLIKNVDIVNKSDYPIDVFCLTADNLFFTSKEKDNHIKIPSNSTGQYKIGFCPQTTCTTKQTRVCQTFQFNIEGHLEKVNLIGELLQIECDYFPKLIKFENSHLGQQQTCASMFITNNSYRRIFFEFEKHQIVRIQPPFGSIPEKAQLKFQIYFNPNRHHRDHHSYLKAYIRGSHVLQIPLVINTLQPSVHIQQQVLDFGIGILKDELLSKVTINNQDNSFCQVALNFKETQIFLKQAIDVQNQKLIVSLQPKSKQTIGLKLIAKKQGSNKIKLKSQIAQLVGYGPIPSPHYFLYSGKQTLLSITPNDHINYINLTQSSENFKFKLTSLASKKLKLKTQLKMIDVDCKSLITSCNPNSFQLIPGQQAQVTLNFIVIDMQKVKRKAMEYMIIIYIGGQKYTQLFCKVTMPTPSLQLIPNKIIMPTVNLNTWSNYNLKIVNKGFKQIYVKIVKPSNIAFQFQCNLSTNKLTRLKNQIQVPIMFRSKKPISFQINLEIIDNFSKKHYLSVSGTATQSLLFTTPKQNNINSNSQSGSFHSFSTLGSCTGIISQQQYQDVQFINKWLHLKFPAIKSQYKNFYQWIKHLPNFKTFISQFGITLSKHTRDLPSALQQLKKLGYQLNSMNIYNLMNGDSHDWLNFIWHFLSFQFVSNDTLKWLQSLCGITFDSYDTLLLSYKKVLIDVWNRIYQGILISRIKQWSKICQKVYPYLNSFNQVNNRRQLIVVFNQLYHKLAKPHRQVINTDSLSHTITVQNLLSKIHLNYWAITGKDCILRQQDKKFQLYSGQKYQIKINIKSNCQIIILNDSFYQPIHIYEIRIFQHHPIINQVNIQCQDKCTQQWSLDYICPIQSPYKVDFNGDSQFRIKIPPLGILKQQEVIPIRLFYSPNNLKNHSAKLTVSNKYSKQIYQIKGIPLCSQVVQMEKRINPIQGFNYKQTLTLPWELPPVSSNQDNRNSTTIKNNFQIIQYNGHHEELVLADTQMSKLNRKQIKLKFQFRFQKIYRNLELLYQIISDDQTSKIVRFIVNVNPKPITVQVKIKCQIGNTIKQKIPLSNPLKIKDLVKIENANKYEQKSEFKLSKYGGIRLQPNQTQYVTLSYKPQSLNSTKAQYVLTYQQSGMIYNYNILGEPQLPTIRGDPITIQCVAKKVLKTSLKIEFQQSQFGNFAVTNNLKEIIGQQSILVKQNENNLYGIEILCDSVGILNGQLIFKNDKKQYIYSITILAKNQK